MMAAMVEWVLRSSALALLVWLALKALRVRNPRLERSAWLIVLASSWAMPLLMELPTLPAADAPELAWLRHIDVAALPVTSSGIEWQEKLLWAVMAIAAVLTIRHSLAITGWWHVQRRAKRIAHPTFAGLDVRVTQAVSSPAAVFSTVLVPVDFEAWTPQAQLAVIAHERTHIENKDFYVQWLAQLHRCVFWFNPIAWWLARRLSLLSEHISDDAAVQETQERAAYAEVLLGFARRAARSEQLVTMAREKTLGSRIERILTETTPTPANRRKIWLLLGVLVPIVGIVSSFQRATARSNHQLPLAADVVLPKRNPAKPLSQPAYPSASRLAGEQGTVVLHLHVLEDGSVADAIIVKSSGYPDLDYSAMDATFRWQLDPGTIDGAPSRMWGRFAVTFKLAD